MSQVTMPPYILFLFFQHPRSFRGAWLHVARFQVFRPNRRYIHAHVVIALLQISVLCIRIERFLILSTNRVLCNLQAVCVVLFLGSEVLQAQVRSRHLYALAARPLRH